MVNDQVISSTICLEGLKKINTFLKRLSKVSEWYVKTSKNKLTREFPVIFFHKSDEI